MSIYVLVQLARRLEDMGRSRRQLETGNANLVQTDGKLKRRVRRDVHQKLTWAGIREHFGKPEDGGLSDMQISARCAELEKAPPVDHTGGVVAGAIGCKCCRIKVRSDSAAESASEHERSRVKASKPSNNVKAKDCVGRGVAISDRYGVNLTVVESNTTPMVQP